MPPWAFTSLAHSWYPRSNAWPSAEKSPVSDSDAPMVIGPVAWLVAAGAPLEVLELVHAARALSPSTVTAGMAETFSQSRGGTGGREGGGGGKRGGLGGRRVIKKKKKNMT